MSQFETTGGGFIDSGDRKIERRVVVTTDGTIPAAPSSSFPLTNATITKEPGGIQRGVFEFSRAGDGGASYNQYGKRIELTGGSREVSIYNHPLFSDLTKEQIAQIETAVENKTAVGITNETMSKLYGFLLRRTEYFLAPAVVGRVTEVESDLPSLNIIAKVADPPELSAPSDTFWICTAVTATPIGDRFEVTREYTLNFSGWADVQTLYS
jgi:hypothetical protein